MLVFGECSSHTGSLVPACVASAWRSTARSKLHPGRPSPSQQILEYNLRTQRQNNAPPDFPAFVREGYDMTSEAACRRPKSPPLAQRIGF